MKFHNIHKPKLEPCKKTNEMMNLQDSVSPIASNQSSQGGVMLRSRHQNVKHAILEYRNNPDTIIRYREPLQWHIICHLSHNHRESLSIIFSVQDVLDANFEDVNGR